MRKVKPQVWLIILLVGLPQLSETLYTPALTEIAKDFRVGHHLVEQSLTIYLFAFALGVLFWGRISDFVGRKPSFIAGLIIFIIGSLFCATSQTLNELLVGRFIQAFGGSIGSVLCQAMTRDAFQGAELGRIYSLVGTAIAFFPTVGPVIGGLMAEHHNWHYSFFILAIVASLLLGQVIYILPETHYNREKISYSEIFLSLVKNKRVIACGIIVGSTNGMGFSFFAEGPFFLETLGLSPSLYGATFIISGLCQMISGHISKKQQGKKDPLTLIKTGIILTLIANLSLLIALLCNVNTDFLLIITLISQMLRSFGLIFIVSNALSLALIDYNRGIGTASSLFGCYYYTIIAITTFIMALLHNGTLTIMPLYFSILTIIMLLVKIFLLKKS
jgi:DHA1 family bicyclomycin/chloramphenicol resistance-like MFS transporter